MKYIILSKTGMWCVSMATLSVLLSLLAKSKLDGNLKQRYVSSRKLELLPNFYIPIKRYNKLITRCFNELESYGILRFDDGLHRIWIKPQTESGEPVWRLSDSDKDYEEAGTYGFKISTIKDIISKKNDQD